MPGTGRQAVILSHEGIDNFTVSYRGDVLAPVLRGATAGWPIASLRENIIGTDGLRHNGIARYVLIGRTPVVQIELDFGQ